MSALVSLAAARGILLSIDCTQLVEYRGHIQLNKQWAYKLLHRINFMKRKLTTSKRKYSPKDIEVFSLGLFSLAGRSAFVTGKVC